ncbi:hypothetical protein C8R45DRAFT_841908, partial [Mycena sanguinolenta]
LRRDGFDFRVHRVILSRASPFFDSMFSLPQSAGDNDGSQKLAACSTAFCGSGIRDPGAEMADIDGLEELSKIMELALAKYDMQFATRICRNISRRTLKQVA